MSSRIARTTGTSETPDPLEARIYLAPADRTLTIKAQPDLGLGWIKQTARMNAVPSGAVDAYTAESAGLRAKSTGAALWSTLLSGSLALALNQATRAADAAGRQVTLRLVPEADLPDDVWWQPWELVVDPKTNDFLALAAGRSIVRGTGSAADPRPFPADRPLRIDVMRTEPRSAPPVETELGWMTSVLPELGACTVREVPVQTDADVLDRLAHTDADVVHLICFGVDGWHVGPDVPPPDVKAPSASGVLAAQTDQWTEVLEQSSVALVVLNGPTERTAQRLAECGLSVVTHRGRLLDDHAAVFAEVFYRQLLARARLDAVMTEARRRMERRFPGEMAWGSAVLFTAWPPARVEYADPSATHSADSSAPPEPFDPSSLHGDAAEELLAIMTQRNDERLRLATGPAWDESWHPVTDQVELARPAAEGTP